MWLLLKPKRCKEFDDTRDLSDCDDEYEEIDFMSDLVHTPGVLEPLKDKDLVACEGKERFSFYRFCFFSAFFYIIALVVPEIKRYLE